MKWPATIAFMRRLGGPGARLFCVGKVLEGPNGAVFFRKEPERVALMNKIASLSVDTEAVKLWPQYGVVEIHFVDPERRLLRRIAYEDFVWHGIPLSHGAGLQTYVGLDHFDSLPWDYEDDWTTREVYLTDPAPAGRRAWVPLAVPGAKPAGPQGRLL